MFSQGFIYIYETRRMYCISSKASNPLSIFSKYCDHFRSLQASTSASFAPVPLSVVVVRIRNFYIVHLAIIF